MAEALIIEGIQDDPSRVVRRIAGPLYRPLPVIFFLIADGGSNPPLGRTGVGSCGEDLGDHGDIGLIRTLDGCTKASQASPDNQNIMLIDHEVRFSMGIYSQASGPQYVPTYSQ